MALKILLYERRRYFEMRVRKSTVGLESAIRSSIDLVRWPFALVRPMLPKQTCRLGGAWQRLSVVSGQPRQKLTTSGLRNGRFRPNAHPRPTIRKSVVGYRVFMESRQTNALNLKINFSVARRFCQKLAYHRCNVLLNYPRARPFSPSRQMMPSPGTSASSTDCAPGLHIDMTVKWLASLIST